MGLQKKGSSGIYQLAIKSAAATVGAVTRKDPNSLQLMNQEETIKMHHTGEMKQPTAATTM